MFGGLKATIYLYIIKQNDMQQVTFYPFKKLSKSDLSKGMQVAYGDVHGIHDLGHNVNYSLATIVSMRGSLCTLSNGLKLYPNELVYVQ